MLDNSSHLQPPGGRHSEGSFYFGMALTTALIALAGFQTGRVAVHRRLGYAAMVVASLTVVSAYPTAIAMALRGFDLSGNLP